MTSTPPLPPLLELSVMLHDSMRFPGSHLTGSIVIGVPTRQSLTMLMGEGITPIVPPPPPSPAVTPASSTREQSPLLSAPHSPSSAPHMVSPLSRPFAVDLKLQVVGKALCDTGRSYSARALQRFHPAQGGVDGGGGAAGKSLSFKLWSTRVVALSVPISVSESADPASPDGVTGDFPRCFDFRASLPSSLPPSYRGAALSHLYFLHVVAMLPSATAGSGRKLAELKLPFRVCAWPAPSASLSNEDASSAASHQSLLSIPVETPSNLIGNLQCVMLPTPAAAAAAHATATAAVAARSAAASAGASDPSPDSDPDPSSTSQPLLISASPGVSLSVPLSSAGESPALEQQSQHTPMPTSQATVSVVQPNHLTNGHAAANSLPPSTGRSSRRGSASSSSSGSISPGGDSPLAGASGLPPPLFTGGGEGFSAPLTFNISKTILLPAVPLTGKSGARSTQLPPAEFDAHVVKLTLDQRNWRPGDSVRGHMDFSAAQLRTYRVAVSLEQVERVEEDVAANQGANASSRERRTSFSTFHAYTVNHLSSHFLFGLPPPTQTLPNFRTDLVQLEWALKFKFITDVALAGPTPSTSAPNTPTGAAGSDGTAPPTTKPWSFLPAPSSTQAESLEWSLPLTVLPCQPEDMPQQRVIKTVLMSPTSFV